MMISTPTIAVDLIGDPDTPLGWNDGRIVLDTRSSPHVRAQLTIPSPAGAVADALDPRLGARCRIAVTDHDGTRTFDLGLRRRPVQHRPATAELELASDEALLGDYGPLDDDATPLELQHSLRAIVNYVLNEAIPGAELEPGPDVPATRYWAAINRVQNPRADSTAGFSGGTTATLSTGTSRPPGAGTRYVVWTSTAGAPAFLLVDGDRTVTPGRRYKFAAVVGEGTAASAGMYVRFSWVNDAGVTIKRDSSPVADYTTTGLEPIEFEAVAPAGAATIAVHVVGVATSSGQAFALDAPMFYDGPFDLPFFYGDTPDDADYSYEFAGDVDASSSTRTPVVERPPDALIWRAEQSAIEFLAPLVQAYGFRLVCDELRRWTLRDADYLAPGSLTIRAGVNMHDARDELSRDGDSGWCDAAVIIYTWTDDAGMQQRRIDAYALTMPYTSRVVIKKPDTPYPGPGFAQYVVERAQGRGRLVEATRQGGWHANADMPCTLVVPAADPQTGTTDRLEYRLRANTLTATARTTDTPTSAWLLLPAGERWIDSPPGESWLDEEI